MHEQKFQKHNGEEQVLKVTSEDRSGAGGRGRGSFRGRGRGRGRQTSNKDTMECYKCHKLGHFQYECPSWDKKVNYAELDEKEEMLLMSYVELNETKCEDAWFLDSGCSNHMCGNKAMFSEINEDFRHLVKLGNNTRMTVLGKGSVKLQVDGFSHVVTDVYCVPELKNNLLSVGQLQERGLVILIKSGMCKIYHPVRGLIIQTSMTANRMFILFTRTQVKEASCFHAPTQDLAHIWHCRYGHPSHKGLRTLQYKKMVQGLPQLPTPTTMCTACVIGKQHRDPIPKKNSMESISEATTYSC